MLYPVLKAAISGVIIAIVSEAAKRSPGAEAMTAVGPGRRTHRPVLAGG